MDDKERRRKWDEENHQNARRRNGLRARRERQWKVALRYFGIQDRDPETDPYLGYSQSVHRPSGMFDPDDLTDEEKP